MNEGGVTLNGSSSFEMAHDLGQSARPPLGIIDGVTNEFDYNLFAIFIQSINPQIFGVLLFGKHSAIFICGLFDIQTI